MVAAIWELMNDDVDNDDDDDVLHDDEKPKLKPVSPINNYDPPGCWPAWWCCWWWCWWWWLSTRLLTRELKSWSPSWPRSQRGLRTRRPHDLEICVFWNKSEVFLMKQIQCISSRNLNKGRVPRRKSKILKQSFDCRTGNNRKLINHHHYNHHNHNHNNHHYNQDCNLIHLKPFSSQRWRDNSIFK